MTTRGRAGLERLGDLVLRLGVPRRWGQSIEGDLSEQGWSEASSARRSALWKLSQSVLVAFSFVRDSVLRRVRGLWQPRSPQTKGSGGRGEGFASVLAFECRCAARSLRRSPGFTAVAVAILGLGVGANSAAFSIVNALLFSSLPFQDPTHTVRLFSSVPESPHPEWVSYPDFLDYRDRSGAFVAAAAVSDAEPLTLITPAGPEIVIAEAYSAELFSILDVAPSLGRSFGREENEAGSEPAVMISHAAWQKRYGSQANILGQSLTLNGHAVTIVGVGPPLFQGTMGLIPTDYWISMGAAAAIEPNIRLDGRGSRDVLVYARLQPGLSIEQARARIETVGAHLAKEYPETHKDLKPLVMAATEVGVDPLMDAMAFPLSVFLMSVVGLVLVVVCSNVAGLLLMRASSRRKEIALRQALGASRARLLGFSLTEAALLGLMGGVVGILVAYGSVSFVSSHRLPLPFSLSIRFDLDTTVLAFNFLLSLVTGVVFGLAPALKASRTDLVRGIKDEGLALDLGRRRLSLRNFFVVTQVAVSLVLLVGAGLFVRNLSNRGRVDPGFESERAALAVVDVSRAGYDTEDQGRAFLEELARRATAAPEVSAVALAGRVPLGMWGHAQVPVGLPGETADGPTRPQIDVAAVSPRYFEILRIPILRGRGFLDTDSSGADRVAIVSETMAQRLWGSAGAVGQELHLGGPTEAQVARVVGVARDTKVRSIREDPRPYLYVPFSQRYSPQAVIIAGTQSPPAEVVERLRSELRALDPNVALFECKTMREHLDTMLFVPRLSVALLSALGALALVLASVGLYAVVAFSVSQRTRELGIRIALGAQMRQVTLPIVREGLGLAATGVGLGLVFASVATRPLSSVLMDVSATDPTTFATVGLLLLAVTAVASYIPARRATRSDPMLALRDE